MGLRVVEGGGGGGSGTERPNNQPAGVRNNNTQCRVVNWTVVLLSPSSAPVRPSDQSPGQPNRRGRHWGQRNDPTIQQTTVGYGGEGGRRLECQLTNLGGAFVKTQQWSTAGLLHNKRDGWKRQYNNRERYVRAVKEPREHQMGELGAKNQVNNFQNSSKLPLYYIMHSRSY